MIERIENKVSYDSVISSIKSITGENDILNLEVYIISKKVYEIGNSIVVILNMYDDSGEMKALLYGNKNDEFISQIYNVKHGLRYRVSGKVTTLVEVIDEKIHELEDIKEENIFLINAIQCYSDTVYGININDFNNAMDINDLYEIILKHTSYLKNIALKNIKDIKASFNEIIILLNDNSLIVNGVKQKENIREIYYSNPKVICAISNDNVIIEITQNKNDDIDFINRNNYKYKKIITTEFGIVALTHEKELVYFGDIYSSIIDYSRFVDVDDIFLEENGSILVIKEGKKYPLFHI